MYPKIPYQGLSWPVTQHAGVISPSVIEGLLNACMQCRSEDVDASKINQHLVDHDILTPNVRADSNQIDAWRDYQQILSEFGMIYSTRVSRSIRLTPVAMAYLNGMLNYTEMITLQIMRYQYPNGHKSQLSPSLKESYGDGSRFTSFTELQAASNIMVRPAVITWMVMSLLFKRNERATLSLDEMQTYVVRCLSHSDVQPCVDAIVKARNDDVLLQPLPRARRNMADWMKIFKQTPLFTLSYAGDSIALSEFSIKMHDLVLSICNQLSEQTSFWSFEGDNYKEDWFKFYGDYSNSTDWVIRTKNKEA